MQRRRRQSLSRWMLGIAAVVASTAVALGIEESIGRLAVFSARGYVSAVGRLRPGVELYVEFDGHLVNRGSFMWYSEMSPEGRVAVLAGRVEFHDVNWGFVPMDDVNSRGWVRADDPCLHRSCSTPTLGVTPSVIVAIERDAPAGQEIKFRCADGVVGVWVGTAQSGQPLWLAPGGYRFILGFGTPGVGVTWDRGTGGAVYITGVSYASPAWRASIRPGAILVSVDGALAANLGDAELVQHLCSLSRPGVRVQFRCAGQGKQESVEMTPEKVPGRVVAQPPPPPAVR